MRGFDITEEIKQNRIKAVAALRAADDSLRLIGNAYDPETGKMCSCAVITQGLGMPLITDPEIGYDYKPMMDAVAENAGTIWGLNDQRKSYVEDDLDFALPRLTFAQVGDKLAKYWDIES